jgi:hypothetical protein
MGAEATGKRLQRQVTTRREGNLRDPVLYSNKGPLNKAPFNFAFIPQDQASFHRQIPALFHPMNSLLQTFPVRHPASRVIANTECRESHLLRAGLVRKLPVAFALLFGLQFLVGSARGSDDIVAVYSIVAPGYTRPVLPGGGFKLETYAFGDGGNRGGVQKDPTIDRLSFTDIARTLAPTLSGQNYVAGSTSDPSKTNLLIMVYWGTTIGTDDTSSSAAYQIAQSLVPPPAMALPPPPGGGGPPPMEHDGRDAAVQEANAVKAANDSALQQSLMLTQMANRQRDRQNWENAAILGYFDEMKGMEGLKLTALGSRRQDVVDEVEESRYYVVLMAYDFQLLLRHKQRKLLWETRFSIRQRRNDFSKELAAMAESASRFFGQNSDGLRHKNMRDTHVDLGEFKIIRVEPDNK